MAAFGAEGATGCWGLQLAVQGHRAVAFAGWLSNRDVLEASLPSARLGGDSDAELVLGAWLRHGKASLARLRGRFATVLWDGERDRLVATRDAMGTHPLFWSRSGGLLLLSDSVDTLIARPGVSNAPNRAAIADHLRNQWPDPEETFYASVRRVPPGHTLTDDGSGATIHRTWRPALPAEAGWASHEEVERFPERLATAVARCLGVGRAGIWLSGVLDSVSVAAFCAEHVNLHGLHPPVALCLRFPDPETDEEQVQRAVARQLGFEAVVLGLEESVAPKSLVGEMNELSAGSPAPVLNIWLPAYLALSEEGRRRGCETILTGAGGDEWLCVSPLLAADLLAAGDLRGVLRLAQAAKVSFTMSSWQVARSYVWRFGARPLIARRLLPSLAPRALQHRDRWRLDRSTPEWLAPDPVLRRSLGDRGVVRPAPARFYDDELLQGLDHPLVAAEFEQLHEVGRRLGMPIQSPFFDVDLVELLCRVHPDTLNRGGRSKGLVRSTVHRRFPDLSFDMQKKVSAGPTLDRLLAPGGHGSWQLGPDSALVRLGVIDRNTFETASCYTMASGSRRDRWAVLQVKAIDAFASARW